MSDQPLKNPFAEAVAAYDALEEEAQALSAACDAAEFRARLAERRAEKAEAIVAAMLAAAGVVPDARATMSDYPAEPEPAPKPKRRRTGGDAGAEPLGGLTEEIERLNAIEPAPAPEPVEPSPSPEPTYNAGLADMMAAIERVNGTKPNFAAKAEASAPKPSLVASLPAPIYDAAEGTVVDGSTETFDNYTPTHACEICGWTVLNGRVERTPDLTRVLEGFTGRYHLEGYQHPTSAPGVLSIHVIEIENRADAEAFNSYVGGRVNRNGSHSLRRRDAGAPEVTFAPKAEASAPAKPKAKAVPVEPSAVPDDMREILLGVSGDFQTVLQLFKSAQAHGFKLGNQTVRNRMLKYAAEHQELIEQRGVFPQEKRGHGHWQADALAWRLRQPSNKDSRRLG